MNQLKIVKYILIALLFTSTANSQSITLSPVSGTFSDDGDYFSDIRGKSKTFDSYCDVVDQQHYFTTKLANNSVWTGVAAFFNDAFFSLIHLPTINTALAQKIECGPDAFQKPIDVTNYPIANFKLKTNASATNTSFFWSRDFNPAIRGGFLPIGGQLNSPPLKVNQWNTFWYFLPGHSSLSEAWSGNITGLSITPALSFPAGSTVELDWIRLVNTNNSNFLNLVWSNNTAGTFSPNVSIYFDNDNVGYNGTTLFTNENVSSNRQVPLGMLAPGTYYAYASLDSTFVSKSVAAYSNYVGPIIINAKPSLTILAPSKYSGSEYSRDERGDAWDFNSLTDLSNVPNGTSNPPQSYRYFHDYFIYNGIFFAESDSNKNGNFGDVQMHPTVDPSKPIRPNIYRYFCVKMQFDPKNMPRDGNLAKLSDAGWYARVMYANSKEINSFGSTKGFEVVETSTTFPDYDNGFVTYCLDLWDSYTHDSGKRFLENTKVDGLRFDPHEAFDPTKFAVDNIGLYSENYTNSNSDYLVKWNINDKDSSNFTINIYVDTDNIGFDGTLVKSVNQSAIGNGETTINLANFTNGNYYIYLVISDGINNLKLYANEIVKKLRNPFLISSVKTYSPCDFDGDTRSDFVLTRNNRNNSQWNINTQANKTSTKNWGKFKTDFYLDSDSNGDKKLDLLSFRNGSQLQWSSFNSTTNSAAASSWGIRSDTPVTKDFDGDGKSDQTVFRDSDGSWWTNLSNGGSVTKYWGLPGDVSVAADYDGDGKADYAIWRPSSGHWAIALSTNNYDNSPDKVIWKQWGVAGDYPMVGDYTGDGIADLTVYRPSNGAWYICKSDTNFDCTLSTATQFGLNGDFPIHFDTDGDNTLEFAVFRPNTTTWFIRNSLTGVVSSKKYGSKKDYPVCTSPIVFKNTIK